MGAVHSTPTWSHFSLTPFLIFKWEWKLNSLGTESSPGFSLGKVWRQPFGCEEGASKDFLKLSACDKCTGFECLWADEGLLEMGRAGKPLPPVSPAIPQCIHKHKTGSCPSMGGGGRMMATKFLPPRNRPVSHHPAKGQGFSAKNSL